MEAPTMQRKSGRLVKAKQEPAPQEKKRVKKIYSRLCKRRKTMQVSSFESLDDDDEDKPIEKHVQEAMTTIRKKAWKPKVENLNL